MPDPVMPSIVADLRGFQVEIRCRRCGRTASIQADRMATKSGHAIDRRMPLPKFLTKLTCTERACGEKPMHLHLIARTPAAPGEKLGPAHRWIMDARGRWTYQGVIEAED